MNDNSTIARASALSCEAVKYAYRQTRDGVVVSFVLHPNDVPDGLALASIGSRWQLAMVELNDDDTPKEITPPRPRLPQGHGQPSRTPDDSHRGQPHHEGGGTSSKERRPLSSLPLPQQAGIIRKDPVFWAFVREEWDMPCESEADAAAAMHARYGIVTCSILNAEAPEGKMFIRDREQFQAWRLVGA